MMQLKQIPGSITNLVQVNDQNQIDRNTYYGYGNGKKRCWKDYVQDNFHRGLDPLAWAYILWRFSPPGFYFDDYS